LSYRRAGVDTEAGGRAVDRIRRSAAATSRPEVLGDIGGFGAAFSAAFERIDDPVLVSATDGVGTKLSIAQAMDRHDTIGIDLVAMVVDDIVCSGAEPLFFLDYIACGRVVVERIDAIVRGIAEGCRTAGCALVGGETAEHPGTMDPDAYDLAGFGVGVVAREHMLGPERVREGDAVVGLASSGLHANGYSLVRRILLDRDLALNDRPPGLDVTLGEELLRPTRIYAPVVSALADTGALHAAAHITGGGFPENVPRALPEGLEAVIRSGSWPSPPILDFLRESGGLEEEDMRRTFNLGIGMTLVVAPDAVEDVIRAGDGAYRIGEVRRGTAGVSFEG
jgi:phosphoribosylformylglycinamidine cyclo-ligase